MLKAIINSIFFKDGGTNITDNSVVRGNGTGGGVQGSAYTISDSGTLSSNAANYFPIKFNLNNDTSTSIFVDGFSGISFIVVGSFEEWAIFGHGTDGTVTLIQNSANVTTTQGNAGTFNIYDNGTGVSIENKLGATKLVGRYSFF